MDTLLNKLVKDFPDINFLAGENFHWSPHTHSVIYRDNTKLKNFNWSLLHEVAHASLGHNTYSSDIELLCMEVAAWQKAKELALNYAIAIDDDHIQNSLDSYRNWLHQRSTCPVCETHALQSDSTHYHCFNCHAIWKVTVARFCRPYRKKESQIKTSPTVNPQVMFL